MRKCYRFVSVYIKHLHSLYQLLVKVLVIESHPHEPVDFVIYLSTELYTQLSAKRDIDSHTAAFLSSGYAMQILQDQLGL